MSNENVNETMETDSVGESDKSKKSGSKKWGIIGGIAVALAVLIAGISIYNTPANRLSRQLDLGNRFLEEQNYEQAIVEFDKAIAIDPMSVEAYLGKTQAYEGLGDIDMAIQTLESGLERTDNEQIKGRLVEHYLEQAKARTGAADYEKALEIYDRLLELDGENEHVQSAIRDCLQEYLDLLMEQERYDEAKALIEKYQDKVSGIDFQAILDEIVMRTTDYVVELTNKATPDEATPDETTPDETETADYVVEWTNEALEAKARLYLNKPEGEIWKSEVGTIQGLLFQAEFDYEGPMGPLDDLRHFTGLKRLVLSDGADDISALSHLTNLTDLLLSFNEISDISALSNLSNLEYLDLSYNNISDINALSNLTNLETLVIAENSISDISALSNLTNLKYLSMSKNSISDISALSSLTNLEYLDLIENNISDISALSSLTNLERLALAENNISDISPLGNLTNLRDLTLWNNEISDVSALSNLTNLDWLGLTGNPVTDYSPVSFVKSLYR